MKRLFLLLIFTNFAGLAISQNDSKNCYVAKRILPVRYEPSIKGKLIDSEIKNVVFKVDDSQKSKILKARLTNRILVVQDSLTNQDLERIDSAINKYRISYFANYSDSTIWIPRILNRITLLQEAMDEDGIWRPIESSDDNLFCGNTDHGLIELKPGEFIEIYIINYCGEFQTKLRMKLLTENEVFVSEEYVGFVNLEQFDLDSISDEKNVYFINSSVEDERNRVLKIKSELKQK